jgi:6-phosphofructokinase 1
MKMAVIRGNAIIGQSGGPTAVINQSLVGVIEAARKIPEIEHVYGARHGVKGILNEDFIDLLAETPETLEKVAMTPSSGLGSVRKKPGPEECRKMFEVMKKNNIRYFFYIGGNDSAETTHIINEEAKAGGYELHCFHVPKTVDNDLRINDHTPGFGSAARFVASAVMGDNLDNRALPGVKIDVIMGRHAGFLTAAAALGRKYHDDGPHLVYVPERPISRMKFVADVKAVYDRLGRCVVAVSEGIVDAEDPEGRTFTEVIMSEAGPLERDTHGNVQLSGSGSLGDWLSSLIKTHLGASLRVRADTFGYLQRSFPGVVSPVDAAEARECGRKAVEFATSGEHTDGSVAIIRLAGEKYAVRYERTELRNVAKETKHLPDHFINEEGNNVTEAFMQYGLPLIGELPENTRLAGW